MTQKPPESDNGVPILPSNRGTGMGNYGGAYEDFLNAHRQADTDQRPTSLHHTIGNGTNQVPSGAEFAKLKKAYELDHEREELRRFGLVRFMATVNANTYYGAGPSYDFVSAGVKQVDTHNAWKGTGAGAHYEIPMNGWYKIDVAVKTDVSGASVWGGGVIRDTTLVGNTGLWYGGIIEGAQAGPNTAYITYRMDVPLIYLAQGSRIAVTFTFSFRTQPETSPGNNSYLSIQRVEMP